MKFSFESQQYRDDFASELVEAEKSDRKALLEEKKRTLKFVLAEHVRDFTRKNDKRRQEVAGEDDAGGQGKEKVERGEVAGEDDEGNEYRVELEITDISDQVPESVRIIYDMNRLLEVESTFQNDDISRGWRKEDENYHDREYGQRYINRDQENPVDHIVKKYIQMAEKEKGEPLTKDDGTPIDDAELVKIAEQAKGDFTEFREKMTDGLVSDPHVFYHTIGAYTEGFDYDWYKSPITDDAKKNLRNRFPNNSEGAEITEKPLEIDSNLQSDGLWVNAQNLVYDNMLKPLMLIDGDSPRFRKHVFSIARHQKQITLHEGHAYIPNDADESEIEEAIKVANTNNQFGAKLRGKNGPTIHWLQIADQIFDPYHGRLIKIKELEGPFLNNDFEKTLSDKKQPHAEDVKIEIAKNIIDLAAEPLIPDGFKGIEIHQQGPSDFEWNPEKVALYLSENQEGDKTMDGNVLREELAGKSPYNANMLDYLIEHPDLIPEDWADKHVCFWGTIYRDKHDFPAVRYLYRGTASGQWDWRYWRVDAGYWKSKSVAACQAI